jgi:hypothetical protein
LSGHNRALTLAKHFALKTLLNVLGFVRVSKGKDPGQDWVRRCCPLPSRHHFREHKSVAKAERPPRSYALRSSLAALPLP